MREPGALMADALEAMKQGDEARAAYRKHVMECSECTATEDGEVWLCRVGAALKQKVLKVGLFR